VPLRRSNRTAQVDIAAALGSGRRINVIGARDLSMITTGPNAGSFGS
jgi:hypothetical protein